MSKLPKSFISNSGKKYIRTKKQLGEGGNSFVYAVKKEDLPFALKISKSKPNTRQRDRFTREVSILVDNQDIDGVIKVHDTYDGDGQNQPFYVMDEHIPALEYLKTKSTCEVIIHFKSILHTLSILNTRGIQHRDIKPENILFRNNKAYIADFGLAYREGDDRITKDGDKQIGARMTMAPEMIRAPRHANYSKADVYSLAKTFWILLSADSDCFDGCYSTHGKESLWDKGIDIVSDMETFLTECTSNDPDIRWSIERIISSSEEWITLLQDENKKRLEAWSQLKKRIFPHTQPERSEWIDIDDILKVLNLATTKTCINHSFFPTGGGLDLTYVKKSYESDCLELNFSGQTHIVKHKRLAFYSPGLRKLGEQDYFILEVSDLDMISGEDYNFREELTELSPLNYTTRICSDWDDFNGKELPETARKVTRWQKGKFAICMRKSFYNLHGIAVNGKTVDAYSAPHNEVDESYFFNFYKAVCKELSKEAHQKKNPTLPSYLVPEKTNLKRILLNDHQLKVLITFKIMIDSIQRIESFSESLSYQDYLDAMDEYNSKLSVLKKFTPDEVQLITAIMYAGRDNRPPYGVPLDEQLSFHKIYYYNIHNILSKDIKAIIKYIKNGIAMYSP